MKRRYLIYTLLVSFVFIVGCESGNNKIPSHVKTKANVVQDPALFTLLDSKNTKINFTNQIEDDFRVNTYDYVNALNGGGVAIGDINNDGLQDIYFTGNMVSNRLYLNKGNMEFQDITVKANVADMEGWSSGVTMVDINSDGYLDLYVCRSFSDEKPELRENLLYVNNGDLTFTEMAKEYGINDGNHSTQALFLDYDLDGYLDLYVGNHPREFIGNDRTIRFKLWKNPPLDMSDRLYRNNGDGSFEDVTRSAGVLNHCFTLGIASSDINHDGWPDIYVAVDHGEPDNYYVNNGDGTFSNQVDVAMKHISNFAMGLDVADINNDALLDIVELDMMAQDNFRQKTQMSGMAPERFWTYVEVGYHYQYMRNTLQLNNGNGMFSEIGQLSGISNTDWSWAALLADFDNDGNKDLYICNGYREDRRDNDHLKRLEKAQASAVFESREDALRHSYEFSKTLKAAPIVNYFFRNNGDLTFSNVSASNGITMPSFSSGAAYGDLDNDGDLDLVVSNLDHESFVYRNNAKAVNQYHNLRIKLVGLSPNLEGIGTKVTVKTGNEIQYQELSLTRGFQSSVENYLHFGLKEHEQIDELIIQWPDGSQQSLLNVPSDQILAVYQKDAAPTQQEIATTGQTLFEDISESMQTEIRHIENKYDDYAKEILLPHRMSQFGPGLAVGDVNGDGKEDFYLGGAANQSGALYLQTTKNNFILSKSRPWVNDNKQEDIDALFFDMDGDNDQDLYVVSGGNEFSPNSPLLRDRLYINDGKGNFTKSSGVLPALFESGGCVVPGDYDKDGDLDLFVGGRQVPAKYPYPAKSYILENENGRFRDVTAAFAPDLGNPGMVTSAVWTDFDNNSTLDLIIVGEWMPISLYKNNGTKLELVTEKHGLENTSGWWNKIVSGDFDNDGDADYIIGNLGLNYKYKATEREPFHIYTYDFDDSGTQDIALGYYNDGVCFPVRGRQCSSEQMPSIAEKFSTYTEFGNADLRDIYGEKLDLALHYEAKMFTSIYLQNDGNGQFTIKSLPIEAQFSAVQDIIPNDFDKDGNLDLITAGNFHVSEVETGRADASFGLYLKGDGEGGFHPVNLRESGINAHYDARDIALIQNSGTPLLIVANNNNKMQFFEYRARMNK